MGKRWREWIETLLPWFDPATERLRNVRTEAIRRRSISARIRSEKIIAEYERADSAAHVQHQKPVDDARRADDR